MADLRLNELFHVPTISPLDLESGRVYIRTMDFKAREKHNALYAKLAASEFKDEEIYSQWSRNVVCSCLCDKKGSPLVANPDLLDKFDPEVFETILNACLKPMRSDESVDDLKNE